jgi:hypothetical protein
VIRCPVSYKILRFGFRRADFDFPDVSRPTVVAVEWEPPFGAGFQAQNLVDVRRLNAKQRVQRGIVRNRVDEVKTVGSERALFIDVDLLVWLRK